MISGVDSAFAQSLFQAEGPGLPGGEAVFAVPPGMHLMMSVDTLVADVHFDAADAPDAVGHKALAVNLSDLAAMGAEPLGYTLALSLPEAAVSWVEAFRDGMRALARREGAAQLAVTVCPGPLAVTVQIYGLVPEGRSLKRCGATVGDMIYVTGTLGDAGLALAHRQGRVHLDEAQLAATATRLDRPEPRLAAGVALRGLASAAIDISDGLAADLGHVLSASGVGATVDLTALPLSAVLGGAVDKAAAWRLALSAGDDYELCFTVPASGERDVAEIGRRLGLPLSCIGRIEAATGLRLVGDGGTAFELGATGYDHFAARHSD